MLISTDADFRAIARPSQSGECGPVHGFPGDEEKGEEEGAPVKSYYPHRDDSIFIGTRD